MTLKSACVQNGLYSSEVNLGALTDVVIRRPMTIGSGDRSDLILTDVGWFRSGSGVGNFTNTHTIVTMVIEDGINWAPVTKGASRTWVVTPGDQDVRMDTFLPSALSLSKFAWGTTFWLKVHLTFGGTKMGQSNSILTTNLTGTQVWCYNPASTTVSTTDAIGAFTESGTASVKITAGYSPIVLGTFA